jgi:hypothetical protein
MRHKDPLRFLEEKKSLFGFLDYIIIMPYNIHVSLYQGILDYCKPVSIAVMTTPCNLQKILPMMS